MWIFGTLLKLSEVSPKNMAWVALPAWSLHAAEDAFGKFVESRL